MRPNGERTHTAKRTGGQSSEAEPARSVRKAGPAGDGRKGSGGSGGRAEPEQVARKEAVMRAEINLPGNGRRRTAAQPAERRTRTGADGQVDRSAAESSRSGNLPRERTTEAGCGACGTPAAGGSERAGCPEAEPKRACACAGRRGGVSTKGVLPEPAEAVPRSGTEQPEARQARRATAEAERTERESAGVELRRSLRRRCVTQAGSLEGSGAAGSGGNEGRPGRSGARGLILSLRRVGTQAEQDRADEGAGAKGSEGRLRPAQRRSRNAAGSAGARGG